jgi:hypothetical protein
MYGFNSSWNGSREMTPLMVNSCGRKIDWTRSVSAEPDDCQAETEPEPVQTEGWMRTARVLLALGLPVALLIARAITF